MNMLLRTAALFLLCVSTGICATLGYFQTEALEDGEVAAVVTQAAPLDNAFDDKIFGADNSAVDLPEGQVKEPETDKDKHDEDSAAVEGFAEKAVSRDQPPPEEEVNEIRPVQTNKASNKLLAQEEASSWSLNSIRDSFQTVHGYFDSLVELVGGHNGVCQYRCRYGALPLPRPGYKHQEPNGCSSSLVGFQLDMGIPAMTRCCNQLDVCYDTCGVIKYDCDAKFRSCLHDICSDLKKSLGFVSKVQACETMADALYNTVWTLGCRPYMNSQRASCICEGEERDEL
ncbi:group XIIB secretory phospholipase A2-like protein isoform X2 [Poeciliopsis prolifica]|uniref:group XIIB secretory phospholipase A2-like protein isoform X2 n=1 Tax=Poeciliopsis prolifica TaxID=188132 RepID=UPI00241359D3|nr:group XIIB secretory phospholipase A2-like protein isoform X2 [Poeciliopsis prolifica]